jgi:hypothetical protein
MQIIEDREELLKLLGHDLVMCEIGVFKGDLSKFMIDNLKPKELHLIDIFQGQMCSGDKDGNNVVWVNLNEEYEKIKNDFSIHENVSIHKGFSSNILNEFKDEYFDLIYIDGDHTYSGVKNDLNLSYNKIKQGGFICGHDYTKLMFEGVDRIRLFFDEDVTQHH